MLDADRPDLDLVTIVFQDDAVDLGVQLSVVGFAEGPCSLDREDQPSRQCDSDHATSDHHNYKYPIVVHYRLATRNRLAPW